VGQGLEAQLQRMCEDALAKQALLEQAAAPCPAPRGAGALRGQCGARPVREKGVSARTEDIDVCVCVLQQVMGEKAALRARLDNEGQRIEELTAQLARAHPALRGGLSMLESAPAPIPSPLPRLL
jgi:hypothetical protein